MSIADDRARLDEIEEGFAQSTSRFDQNFNEEIDFLIRVARDGLRWREAAAAEEEVEAFEQGVEAYLAPLIAVGPRDVDEATRAGLTAAAAWRAANAPKDEELDEYKERWEISRANVARACATANRYREALEHVQGSDVAMMELLAQARAERDALRAQVEMLREALKPFSNAMVMWSADSEECSDECPINYEDVADEIKFGDLRRAVSVRAATEPMDKQP